MEDFKYLRKANRRMVLLLRLQKEGGMESLKGR